jgi:signal transduction histidine kinase
MPAIRAVAAGVFVLLVAASTLVASLASGRAALERRDDVLQVAFLIVACVVLSLVDVRLDRGRLNLSGIPIGAGAVLFNPIDAALVGLSLGIAMARRGSWPILANAVLASSYGCLGALIALHLRVDGDLSFAARAVILLLISIASWIFVGVGFSLRTGESIASIWRRTLTRQFLAAFAYFDLASLLTSYLLDGSLRGYVLASIVFVLALALTDTIAGRRMRTILESELTDADRHLFHSRAVEGVVHNLRNHMATAVGYLKEIDVNKLELVDRDAVQTAKAATNDAVTVLQSLSQGATPRVTYATEAIDLNQLASLALDMARPRARAKRVELRLQETPDDVKVKADPLLLREVATNLINNAIDAAPDTGHVVISTGRRNGSPYFNVADNGPGVAEENRHHLFEPHFTTKEHGTGLGLFMSYGVVREHQGQLLYEGNRKGGAFTVVLPPFSG